VGFPQYTPTGFAATVFGDRYAIHEGETFAQACQRVVRLIGMGAAVIVRGTSTPCHPPRRSPRAKRRKRGEKPWYRSGDRINPDVLKDPDHYIHTGEIGATPAAWHRLREFLAANPGTAITGLRLQGVKGKELTVLSHQHGYFFGFKGQAIVGGPQQHYVGIGYYDGHSVIINWLALPHFNHQFSEQRSKERAGFMLIENPEDGG